MRPRQPRTNPEVERCFSRIADPLTAKTRRVVIVDQDGKLKAIKDNAIAQNGRVTRYRYQLIEKDDFVISTRSPRHGSLPTIAVKQGRYLREVYNDVIVPLLNLVHPMVIRYLTKYDNV